MSKLYTTYRGVVYPWHCDHMDHMNVMWYVGKFDEATWHLFAILGLTPSFLNEQKRGMAAVEQNISYKRELHAGDIVSIHSGILQIKGKVIRFYHEMRNADSGVVAATTVLTGVHMDLQIRKAVPFPEEIIEQGQSLIVDLEE